MSAVIVFATVPDEACGVRIAEHLVDRQYAACVHIMPAGKSIYRWNGARECAVEHTLVIKSTEARVAELQATIVSLHPYDTPEVLVVRVDAGLPPYLRWIEEGSS
jgi:periplasmic divalent cation tolerance protein